MRVFYTWRSFLLHAGAAAALFAMANVATYWTSGYFQREHAYHAEVEGYFERPRAHVLFAGDSHVAELENDLLAEDAYNIAWGGDSLREIYAKLRYLLARHAAVDTLFLTADPHMFGTGRLESSNRAFVDPYLLRTGSPYGLRRGWPAAVLGLVPLFNDDFVQYLRKRLTGRERRWDVRAASVEDLTGWERLSDEERTAIAVATGEEDHAGIGTHPEPILWYRRIVDLARAHGIRVIAILYPAHPGYLQSISPAAEAFVQSELEAAGIRDVLDFRRTFTGAGLFIDPDHLNRRGAIELLRLIDERTGERVLATEWQTEEPLSVAARRQG